MKYQHKQHAHDKQQCGVDELKTKQRTEASVKLPSRSSSGAGCCQGESSEPVDSHHHGLESSPFLLPAVSFLALVVALIIEHYQLAVWFDGWVKVAWYVAAYAPVGLPVLKEAVSSVRSGELFSEFLLMSIATLGAFAIGQYPEGVAVMLFYSLGELFQMLAVKRARLNIKTLLDQRPDEVTLIENGKAVVRQAKSVAIGEIIQLKAGEKLGLDGELLSDRASFNSAALTGESIPDTKLKGEQVLAGMINLERVSMVKVTTAYADSKLSRILELVQNAASQKAPTELFIRRFAKIYTPIVVGLAITICALPYFLVDDYSFAQWLYRALVFLVISCPCALVISIPLGYFGGIGAASRNGILVKGGHFLDVIATISHIVMDKTGTLTEGVFKVQDACIKPQFDSARLLAITNKLESQSSHPVATAIHQFVGDVNETIVLNQVEEIAGHGLKAVVDNKEFLVGNFKLLDKFEVVYDIDPNAIDHTLVAVAYDRQFAGYITIADNIKNDARIAVDMLKRLGITITMLSGDKSSVVKQVAQQLGITKAYGDLLPEDKVIKLQEVKAQYQRVAFVGDGVNDAPVIALSDVGVAMGGLGSDATIETADIVIQDDKPSKIPMAIAIGKKTKAIVWQNIVLAFSVKAVVLLLGAVGLASLWGAVFADVGVALLAILNAVRVQNMRFED